jgi:hypothetical protein
MRRLVAVTVLAAVALAGCGSSSSNSSNDTGANNGGSKGGGNDFASLVAKTSAAKYKVTYQSGSDAPFTISQDPPRFSYITDSSATYVTSDGAAVTCSGSGASATCTQMPGSGASIKQGLTSTFGAIGALFVSEAGRGIPGLSSIKTTDKSIAGRDAACATLDGSILGVLGAAIKGSYSVCVDKKTGVMLESKADDGNGKVADIKATAFSDPSDSDLTPPVSPVTIPGVPST